MDSLSLHCCECCFQRSCSLLLSAIHTNLASFQMSIILVDTTMAVQKLGTSKKGRTPMMHPIKFSCLYVSTHRIARAHVTTISPIQKKTTAKMPYMTEFSLIPLSASTPLQQHPRTILSQIRSTTRSIHPTKIFSHNHPNQRRG